MLEKNTKVVFIDKNIIDNNIYMVVDGAYDYNSKLITYIIDGRKKFSVQETQIREATTVEIDNGIKFDPIEVKTVVAYVDLLKPNNLLKVTDFNDSNLKIVTMNCFTNETLIMDVMDVRPARIKECEEGRRITIYSKDLFYGYMNPFMVYDIYNINNPSELQYSETLTKLGLLCNNKLSENGERLSDDIDFDQLLINMYDLTMVNPLTTHIATDKDGTVTEFKLRANSLPMYDDVNHSWYIVENETDKIISKNKVIGMMKVDQFINSLKEI